MYKEYLTQRGQIDALQDYKRQAEINQAGQNSHVEKLEAQLVESVSTQAEAAEEYSQLDTAHDQLRAMHRDLTADYTQLRADFDSLQTHVDEGNTELGATRQMVVELQNELATSAARCATLVEEEQVNATARTVLQADLLDASGRCDALQDELGTMLAESAMKEATAECMREWSFECFNEDGAPAAAAIDESWGAWSDDLTNDGAQTVPIIAEGEVTPRSLAANLNSRVQGALEKLQCLVNEELLESMPSDKPQMLPLITISESPLAISHRRALTYAVSVMSTPLHKAAAPPTPTALPLILIEDIQRVSPLAKLRWGVAATPDRGSPPAVTHCGVGTSPIATLESSASPMTPVHVATSCVSPMTPAAAVDCGASPMPMATMSNTGSGTRTVDTAAFGTSPMATSPLGGIHALDGYTSPRALRAELDTLAISNEVLREDQRAREDELIHRTSSLSAANEQLAFTTTLLEQARAERDASSAAKDFLEIAVVDGEQARADALAERNETASFLRELQSRVNHTAVALAEMARSNLELQTELAQSAALDEINNAATGQVVGLEDRLATVEAEGQKKLAHQVTINKNLQSDLKAVYGTYKRDLARLEKEYRHDDYKARYQALLARSSALQARMQSMQACRVDLERTAEIQRTTSVTMQETCRSVILKHTELVAAHLQLEQTNLATKRNVESAAAVVTELKARIVALEIEVAIIPELRAEKEDTDREKETIRAQLSADKEKIEVEKDLACAHLNDLVADHEQLCMDKAKIEAEKEAVCVHLSKLVADHEQQCADKKKTEVEAEKVCAQLNQLIADHENLNIA